MKRLHIGNFVVVPEELFIKLCAEKRTQFTDSGALSTIMFYKSNTGLLIVPYTKLDYANFVSLQKIEKLLNKKIFIINNNLRSQIW